MKKETRQQPQVPVFKDQTLVCQDCKKEFTFEAGEQAYYYHHGLAVPRRCPRCRFLRRLEEVGRA